MFLQILFKIIRFVRRFPLKKEGRFLQRYPL